MTEALCTIIIPSWDNPNYLIPCINSILMHTVARENMRILVVNNGAKEVENHLTVHPLVSIVHAGKNLGWEGGLKLGLEHTTSEIVCFMNDDTFIPYASNQWLSRCISIFKNKNIAAVGPTSNVVRGMQNVFFDQFAGSPMPYTSFLIGFCMFVRRSDLEAAGGIDDTLPGGDDFDLSIRLRKLGKKLAICRDAFVFHHGFKTGERLRGGPDKPGGWNSQEMSDRTNMALIRKHGFSEFHQCNYGGCENPEGERQPSRDVEKAIVAGFVKPGVIYDLGCGSSKTVEGAIGIDRVPMGDMIPFLGGAMSAADLVGDVSEDLPVPDGSADTIITRHILEHCVDPVKTLRIWIKKLKPDGRLVVTVPDERIGMTIPLNPEHRHAYTPDSFQNLMTILGMKQVEFADNYNGVSFTAAMEKNGVHHG